MLRPLILLCIGLLLVAKGIAQTDLEKLVDTERAFARMAAEKGTKTAFLANMTDDALVFGPDKAYGKPVWSARPDGTPGVPLLSWEPNYADISANGILGYTTGNWEFRPKGKDDSPSGFGEFVTVWLRQPDGRYKWVVDIGVGHPKPEKYLTKWTTSAVKGTDLNRKNLSAADGAQRFLDAVKHQSAKKAYAAHAASDIRLYREDRQPIVGKTAALAHIASEKGTVNLAEKSTFFGSADLAYATGSYTRVDSGKVIETGNYMQIWKLIDGKWQIVLDIFKLVPQK